MNKEKHEEMRRIEYADVVGYVRPQLAVIKAFLRNLRLLETEKLLEVAEDVLMIELAQPRKHRLPEIDKPDWLK